jgi:TonB-dependent siderophore receptor
MKLSARIALGLSLVALVAAPSFAQDPAPKPAGDSSTSKDSAKPPTPRFEDVVDVTGEPAGETTETTVTKFPVSLQKLPASVSVIPKATFEEQDARVLGDALKNAPGLNVAPGFGTFDFFTIRGFDSLSTGLVMTDGAMEPESSFYPLYNVRRVEVVRGPAAFAYGPNPLSGAVNLVRKQPTGGRFADVSVGYGSFDEFIGSLDANATTGDGRLSVRLNGYYQNADGYRNDKAGDLAACNPAVTWRPDERTRLVLNVEYVAADFAPDSGIPVLQTTLADVDRKNSYQSQLDQSEQDIYRYRLDFDRKVNDRLSLRDKLYYTDFKWDSDGTLINGAFPSPFGGMLVARTLVQLDDRQKLFGNQAEAVLSFKTGSLSHSLVGGFEVSHLGDQYTQDVAFLDLVDLDHPVDHTAPPLFNIPQLGQRGDASSLILAPYVVDQIALTSKLQATAGARLDVLDYDDPLNATTRDATHLSPLGGLVFTPVPSVSLYANAAAAFGPPSTQVIGPRDPEESRQFEIGAKASFLGGKGRFGAALYDLKRENIAIPDSTGVTRQQGDQSSKGLELDLTAEITPGWSTTFAYAFNDSELTHFAETVQIALDPPAFAIVDRSGNTAPFAPRHVFNLWTSTSVGHGLRLGLGARYVSEQFIAENNDFRIDGYFLLDAMASYTRGRVTASLNLKNITDQAYETRGFGPYSAIPGNPFGAYGRIAVAFGGSGR